MEHLEHAFCELLHTGWAKLVFAFFAFDEEEISIGGCTADMASHNFTLNLVANSFVIDHWLLVWAAGFLVISGFLIPAFSRASCNAFFNGSLTQPSFSGIFPGLIPDESPAGAVRLSSVVDAGVNINGIFSLPCEP
jgi:hypothetical protein